MGDDVWVWGVHAAAAALANPKREIKHALLSRNAAQKLRLDPDHLPAFAKLVEPRALDDHLPDGAVHQGVAVRAAALEPTALEDAAAGHGPLLVLDQVTDPQNVGAIYRSAAAFGVKGVVMQTRKAPPLQGALAKAAAGAVETVDEIRVVNIARALDALSDAGWNVVGLAGEAATSLETALDDTAPTAIVLGAEGTGLRPAVASACSQLARIPIRADMESLNVSNAGAIAVYELARSASNK